MRCTACSAALTEGDRSCPRCGAELDVLPTGTAPRPAPAREPATPGPSRARTPAGRTPTSLGRSSVVGSGRFVPGDVVGDRFRIVGLLGRGGMGEVYRADDLKLDQVVALKFLPQALHHDVERRERFYGEVRLARQISHPAVCRVYDVVEDGGAPILSMEYVDGEDLASLLRRIGRLPADKALDIARQLCAGLAAAHEKGVLHRDLKPENVMLDGRGDVRIMDFGLAVAADAVPGHDVSSGTPAYMAPEQISGREVTPRSDVYALGLVLYELFTGRRAFEAPTRAEMQRKHLEEPPLAPSDVVPDIDPVVERAILRCLEKDPRRRPGSAFAVAAALPGGDPLAAALAAGETPSPELVAAAGEGEGLSRRAGWMLLAVCAGAVAVAPWLARPLMLFQQVPIEKTPAVLEDRARELLARLAPAAAPSDSARGFGVDQDYLQHVQQSDRSRSRWQRLGSGPPAVYFWYRQSPRKLVSNDTLGHVYWANPPATETAMAGARFDMRGRLLHAYVIPPQLEAGPVPAAAVPEAEWAALFADAGFDLSRFRPAQPRWTPPFYADTRVAWEGSHPEQPNVALRVEAAAYGGRPVYFQVLPPWSRADRMTPFAFTGGQRAAQAMVVTLLMAIVFTAAFLAWRHVSLGRGDKAGARRLARYVVAMGAGAWLLNADHVFDLETELSLALRGLGAMLVMGLIVWTLYLALEPVVRRRWPQTLITWTRLLAGRWRDPLVGRDVLIGCAAGTLMLLAVTAIQRLPGWVGAPPPVPRFNRLDALFGPHELLKALMFGQVTAVGSGLGFLLLLTLARHFTGRLWLGTAVVVLIFSIPDALSVDLPPLVTLALGMTLNAAAALVLIRFGLLAGIVTIYLTNEMLAFPLTADVSSWLAGPTLWLGAAVLALAAYAFRTALGGRSAFSAGLLPD